MAETTTQERPAATAEPDWMREGSAGELMRHEAPPQPQARVVRELPRDTTKQPQSETFGFYEFHTPQFGDVAAALSEAQGKLTAVVKNMARKVKSRRSDAQFDLKWATLDEFLETVRPVLASCGLALVQLPLVRNHSVMVKTVLIKGEQQLWNYCVSPLEAGDAWAVGGATTYAKKGGLSALLGIAAAEEDDESGGQRDGEEHNQRRPAPQPAQRRSAARDKDEARPEPKASEPQPAATKPANGNSTVQGHVVKMQTKEDAQGHVTFFLLDTGLKAWTRDTALAVKLENLLDESGKGALVAATTRKHDNGSPELIALEEAK